MLWRSLSLKLCMACAKHLDCENAVFFTSNHGVAVLHKGRTNRSGIAGAKGYSAVTKASQTDQEVVHCK